MFIELYSHQLKALEKMHNGCILCGGVGSGKSRTAIAYYFLDCGGEFRGDNLRPRDYEIPLYIITTAKKRDSMDWELEMAPFLVEATVDSWNNIKKYENITGAWFIFDEQRVVGTGAWAKTFIKIAKRNKWILLSATPGDTWSDYAPVMIANGYFKNFTEFRQRHCVYSRFSKYPKIDRYVDTVYLTSLRNKIMVNMPMKRKTKSHTEYIETKYDRISYKEIMRTRMNPETGEPFMSAAELCLALRKVVNTDPSKAMALLDIWQEHRKCIVFYNFNYELDILEEVCQDAGIVYAQWNGHRHENIPSGDEWMYLVQYTAGAEGWNCTLTDTIIFFSQNYSYKIMSQSSGRINRLNTEFVDLWYYILRSASSIDLGISRALKEKKDFNANGWLGV